MGRRKIEIQPITHERNRSVTFLKRKNGLFKKAYELGVLCSVDVAVVIFEERAGHHLKLYQYCSGDIHDIIQRHVRYDGEKDTRTPHDFANNANAKLNNDAEVDDDDVDDDDDPDSAPIRGNRKRHESKLKAEYSNNPKLHIPPSGGDMGLSVDMADYHRPMTIPPPPMPIHHSSQLASAGGGSSLPISTERHTSSGRLLPPNGQLSSQKKPRLAPSVHAGNGSKLSGDESMYNGYLPSPTSAHPSAYRSNGPSSHQLPYNGYMGVSNNSPSQSFLPSSFDFPSSSSRGSNLPRNNSYSQRSSFSQPQEPQLQGMYHQLMRHNLPHGQHSHSSGLQSQQSPDNLLSTFLDNDEHRQPQGTGSQFAPLDWPTHGASQQPPPSTPSQPAQQESGPPGDTSWLDFLSQNAPQSSAQPLHMTLPPTHPNGRDGLSWERDHDAEHYSVERGGGAGGGDLSHPDKSPTSGGALMSPRSSRKRPRADSGGGNAAAADEKRPSPSARAATVSGHDKIHDASSGAGIDKQDK